MADEQLPDDGAVYGHLKDGTPITEELAEQWAAEAEAGYDISESNVVMLKVDGLTVRPHFEDGQFWATVDEHPGMFATGGTLKELRASVREGIALKTRGESDG